MPLSERAQERQFTCDFLAKEIESLAKSYTEYRDAHVSKGDFSEAFECNSKAEAFKQAARNIRSFGCV